MPKVLIYSDPHLGLRRAAHFTPTSNALREQTFREVLLERLREARQERVYTVCAGDFFDTESNSEETILRALDIADFTDTILAGNHDVPNRDGRASSLEIVAEMYPGRVVWTPDDPASCFVLGNTVFFCAPHRLDQETFLRDLDALEHTASSAVGYRVLIAHCNFGLSDAFATPTSLNLSRERAAKLLGTFHFILLGHEHTPADHFDGRLKVIGSVFPTAFDNMGSKRMLSYDADAGVFSDVPLWDANAHLWSGRASQLDISTFSGNEQFFDVLDDLEPGQAQKHVVSLFKTGAFAVRLRAAERPPDRQKQNLPVRFDRLPQTIAEDLEREWPQLLDLWLELSSTDSGDRDAATR